MATPPLTDAAPPKFSRRARFAQKSVPVILFLTAGVVLVVIVGVAQRLGWIRATGEIASSQTASGSTFTCPMHPQIRQPAPGRCPICGMALVPASSANADLDAFAVKIEAGTAAPGEYSNRQSGSRSTGSNIPNRRPDCHR